MAGAALFGGNEAGWVGEILAARLSLLEWVCLKIGSSPNFMALFHEEIRNMIINQWIWVPFLGQSRCLNFHCLNFHLPATNPLFAGYLRFVAISIFLFGLAILAVQVGVH